MTLKHTVEGDMGVGLTEKYSRIRDCSGQIRGGRIFKNAKEASMARSVSSKKGMIGNKLGEHQ